MAREVKIVVKNVYAPAELQQFIVEETALVKQLKTLVHEQFPGNPLPAHQKIIFGGKICADSDPLQKILNVVRIHLSVCALMLCCPVGVCVCVCPRGCLLHAHTANMVRAVMRSVM